ncbi:MAG: hypothetical protein ACXVPX_04235 [Actinomycetota bacterium]
MRLRTLWVAVAATTLIAVSAAPATAATPVPVVATDKIEILPVASAQYVAWTVVRFGRRAFHASVFAKQTGTDTVFRVSPAGTNAETGGIDGATLVYQFTNDQGDQDIAVYDLATRTPLDAPAGVNTARQEFAPSISGTELVFGRGGFHRSSIVLLDTSTGTSTILATRRDTARRAFGLFPGQVNGNWVVWNKSVASRTGFEPLTSNVFVYDISAGTTSHVPDTNQPVQYAPSVTSDGTVYYGESGNGCAVDATIMKMPAGGTPSLVYSMPANRDLSSTFVVDHGAGMADLYFDNTNCRTGGSNILEFVGV